MLCQRQMAGVENERIAGDAGAGVVGLRDAAIDDEELAVRLDRGLATLRFHRHMTIYHMAHLRIHTKFRKDPVDIALFLREFIVDVKLLHMGIRILDEAVLEGRHLILSEERGAWTAPHVPEQVCSINFPLRIIFSVQEIRIDGPLIEVIHEGLTADAALRRLELQEGTIHVHRNTAMVEDVVIDHLIHRAIRKEEADMLLKKLRMRKAVHQGVHQLLFLLRHLIRILRVDGREVRIPERIALSVDGHRALFIIDLIEEHPVVELILRMAADQCPLLLKQDDTDGFTHLRGEAGIHRVGDIGIQKMWLEAGTWIIAIHLLRIHRKRAQIDAVAVLEHIEGVIGGGDAKNACDAGRITTGGAHPLSIMISPLDVHIMEAHQLLHDLVRMRASVEDVTDDMEIIDDEVLNQLRQGHDEIITHVDVDDGVHDAPEISPLILVMTVEVQELIDRVGILLRHLLTHLRTGVLGADAATDIHETIDRDALPFRCVLRLVCRIRKNVSRIVDQVRKLQLLLLRQQVAEGFIDLIADDSGGRTHQVDEGITFTMQV